MDIFNYFRPRPAPEIPEAESVLPEIPAEKDEFPVVLTVSQEVDGWWSFRVVLTDTGRDYIETGVYCRTKDDAYKQGECWAKIKASEIRRSKQPRAKEVFQIVV